MKKVYVVLAAALMIAVHFGAGPAALGAEEAGGLSFWADAETGAVFTGYNDVQIPADTGTRFSLAEDLTPAPVWFYRLQAGADYRRHGISVLYAPLLVESTGSYDEDIDFYEKTFAASTDITATYKFNSYRLGYTYTFVERPSFVFAAGLAGKIRDAYIALENDNTDAKRTDLGFVPLIRLSARWNFAPRLSLLLEGDGLAAPQGRAEDFLLAFLYSPDEKTELRLGYRILEGGSAGGGSVYTFSMFHYLGVGIRRRF